MDARVTNIIIQNMIDIDGSYVCRYSATCNGMNVMYKTRYNHMNEEQWIEFVKDAVNSQTCFP